MALIILVVFGLKYAGYLSFVNEEHYHMMGKLLFCFSIFWGYIGFSQYMLIWYGNIPEETEWFVRRNVESWNTLSTAMVVGRFFIPFLYLLFQYTKRNSKLLAAISVWVLIMHVIDIYVTIMPFIAPNRRSNRCPRCSVRFRYRLSAGLHFPEHPGEGLLIPS